MEGEGKLYLMSRKICAKHKYKVKTIGFPKLTEIDIIFVIQNIIR